MESGANPVLVFANAPVWVLVDTTIDWFAGTECTRSEPGIRACIVPKGLENSCPPGRGLPPGEIYSRVDGSVFPKLILLGRERPPLPAEINSATKSPVVPSKRRILSVLELTT